MNKIAFFTVNRNTYRGMTTLGKITLPNGAEYHSLEDVVRGWGIKDKGNTAIPATPKDMMYKLSVSMSSRFKRIMPIIYTEANGYELKAGGISFKGIRIHGGNDHLDVEGCIAAARNRLSDTQIQGTVEKEITQCIQAYEAQGYKCYLRIINNPQAQ